MVDIVVIAIVSVGLTMLPIIPDLLANLFIVILPNSRITSSVQETSRRIHAVASVFISRVLVTMSCVGPCLAAFYQPHMLWFHGHSFKNIDTILQFIGCNALLAVVQIAYYKTTCTEPGFARVQANSDRDAPANVCKKCNAIKPPRAHHCRICKRCVLRMDHHCPFTNCCIGLLNERYFILWLGGVIAGCIYGMCLSWRPFAECSIFRHLPAIVGLTQLEFSVAHRTDLVARCSELGQVAYAFLPAISIFFLMAVLLGWHLVLIAQNITTIEVYLNKIAPMIGDSSTVEQRSHSTGSVVGNFCEVLFPKTDDVAKQF